MGIFLNPFGHAKIFLAIYNNVAVGMLAAIPLKFMNNEKILMDLEFKMLLLILILFEIKLEKEINTKK